MKRQKLELSISASRVGEHYKHCCDRYTVYSILKKPEILGLAGRKRVHTASQEAGYLWEKKVLQILAEAGIPCYAQRKQGVPGTEYVDISAEDTETVLRDPAAYLSGLSTQGQFGYIYQTTIPQQDSFLEEVLLQREDCRDFLRAVYSGSHPLLHAKWSICKPDLIRVDMGADGMPEFSIVDIKHAKHACMPHKVQVAIYVRLLKALLKDKGIKGRVNESTGYLWNFKRSEPVPFDLEPVMPYVDLYFGDTLPDSLLKLAECLESAAYADSPEGSEQFNEAFHGLPSMQCEWCENYGQCIRWQSEHEPVTLIPYLSMYAQLYLREHEVPLDLDGFAHYLEQAGNEQKLKEGCLGLKRMLAAKEQTLEALRSKNRIESERAEGNELFAAPVNKNISSLVMPAGENVRILLTAQRDEATDRMYVMGIRVSAKGIEPEEKVFLAESPERIDENIREFMEYFYGILDRYDQYNKDHKAFADQVSVQAYVMDSYEHLNLEEMLLDELLNGGGAEDVDYRSKLLAILYWLMGEHLVTDVEEQSEYLGVDFPLVVLTEVVKKLFSIPAYISYDLETVSDALLGSKWEKKAFQRIGMYNQLLSNTMRSDAINRIWSGKEADVPKRLEGIRSHILIRLSTENNLINKIRERSGGILKRWPEKFFLPGKNEQLSERAAKLLTEYRYEELLEYHEKRQIRMNDMEDMAEEGQILKVRIIRQDKIEKPTYRGTQKVPGYACYAEILNDEQYFKRDLFTGIMLKAGDEEAREELMRLNKKSEAGILPQIPQVSETTDSMYKRLYGIDDLQSYSEEGRRMVYFKRFSGFSEVEDSFRIGEDGDVFYIFDSYKDFNGSKIAAALSKEGKIEQSFLYPETIYTEMTDIMDHSGRKKYTEHDLEECLACKPEDGGKDFTPSQREAFRQLFFHNIALLLGPPGTGKTDFIARAVLTLCKYYENQNLRISILLSANSHSAINNMLSAIAEKKGKDKSSPMLHKLKDWDENGDGGAAIPGVCLVKDYTRDDPKAVSSRVVYSYYDGRSSVVLGATCWQIGKSKTNYDRGRQYTEDPEFDGFDVVIIDEASQVRAMDAMLMLQAGINKKLTRYLIVGDEDQLSPVLKGKYDAGDQIVDFYASIFRLYGDAAEAKHLDYKVSLEEQFRMNEILSRYPAKVIYDRDMEQAIRVGRVRRGYHAYDFPGGGFGIAGQKLKLLPWDEETDPLAQRILDPDYPLVVCRIHSGDARVKRDEEIRLVKELVVKLREKMCVPGTNHVYESDEAFWGSINGDGGLGIISPHHEQINRLREVLENEAGMSDIFIGTVDKLQGRQREAVIVSYGVTDPEKAALELEFIYSRNRLNVAMTRGKKKTICILSDTLLDRSAETLDVDDERTLRGIDYMTGLLDFMQRQEEDTEADAFRDCSLGDVKIDIFRKRMK
ncbi:MAG: DNA2/NAM7 family helicase [Lachnospiraceae bacterium]|nr:DNA2/NAM7 family helicase [Lachnospiraceae bacterium]